MGNNNITEILLIEDNITDAKLIIESMNSLESKKNIYHFKDGVKAICFLKKQGQYINASNASKQDIIIFDINLPYKNGLELLWEIKQDEKLKNIPIIIISMSDLEKDINKSYLLQASCYITKPVKLDDFWLNFVKLPN